MNEYELVQNRKKTVLQVYEIKANMRKYKQTL
jgi:hypothetical protein